jgi:hypothetical protein
VIEELMTEEVTCSDCTVITHDGSHPLLEIDELSGQPAVELAPGLLLVQLPTGEAETFIEASQERGEEFEAYRQFGQLYSFARLEAPVEPLYTFDSDG